MTDRLNLPGLLAALLMIVAAWMSGCGRPADDYPDCLAPELASTKTAPATAPATVSSLPGLAPSRVEFTTEGAFVAWYKAGMFPTGHAKLYVDVGQVWRDWEVWQTDFWYQEDGHRWRCIHEGPHPLEKGVWTLHDLNPEQDYE